MSNSRAFNAANRFETGEKANKYELVFLGASCDEAEKHLQLAHKASQSLREEQLLISRKTGSGIPELSCRYSLNRFTLFEEEMEALTSRNVPVGKRFFQVMDKTEQICEDCRALMAGENGPTKGGLVQFLCPVWTLSYFGSSRAIRWRRNALALLSHDTILTSPLVIPRASSSYMTSKSLRLPLVSSPPPHLQLCLRRKEGHVQGSRIINIGFVAEGHTALISADESGLAFYHSLGKVLFVEALIFFGFTLPDVESPTTRKEEKTLSRRCCRIKSKKQIQGYTVLVPSVKPIQTLRKGSCGGRAKYTVINVFMGSYNAHPVYRSCAIQRRGNRVKSRWDLDAGKWSADEDILALQWLNVNVGSFQAVVVTASALQVYNLNEVYGCIREKSSSCYAFSEDRMTDETHRTPDGRGVDRTSLFEGLVSSCARACIALHGFEFLFEDLFQLYDDNGISRIFSPSSRCCTDMQTHQLYDALIYVYTRALRDYVAPVVELLGLIRKVHQYRRRKAEYAESSMADMEPVILNAYKIYPYLANILSGLTYPSEQPLSEEEALAAKKAVYTFFVLWSVLVFGQRQLLRYYAESFLHSLDIAFEDAYLNDKSSRRCIPQFLQEAIPFFTLHNILVYLAEDTDPIPGRSTASCTISLVRVQPHNVSQITELFRNAGFFRILRQWHRQDNQWGSLLQTFLQDSSLPLFEMFHDLDEVLETSTRFFDNTLPRELVVMIQDALHLLMHKSPSSTAFLVDEHFPSLHDRAVDSMGDDSEEYHQAHSPHPSPNLSQSLRHLYITLHCRFHPDACENNKVFDAAIWALNQQGKPLEALAKADVFDKSLVTELVDVFQRKAFSTLRSLVQETFSALVSVTTTRAVSFPRLFNRLVNAAPQLQLTSGTQYTEFRSILTGMLESYRSDSDMLIITKYLIDRDLFNTLEKAARERVRG
ncbi:Golgi CORVET complex core vacuolar protein 8-domain-containing protein [Rhodocollybia butyracea]|uniref:Golgi CORVET complex core vacuolar protein 8-domain-containing protein n=1 Tax=Rhodocollybia butyracea TaxID=206335 RepID=A0A9P5TXA7_9AGAR|nr:Golgi CORVET complex core vacuolar protein 8-domain-containing protein [Rhodocollybia butyracea]